MWMFTKLARRNVKRQLGNYLIYFITVSLTVAFMFAINNVIFSEQMQQNAESEQSLRGLLIFLTVFVACIVAFVLGYATSFMLRLRKREFGMYLTLGMTRRNILSIFVTETMLMCAAALTVGILLGLFMYQGMMAVMTRLMGAPIDFAAYSLKGLMLTVILVVAMFVLSSVTSAIYLRRVKIYDLIHGARKVERAVKHPVFWFVVMLLALAVMAVSLVIFRISVADTVENDGRGMGMLASIPLLAIGLVMFHIALARSIANMLLKNRTLCSRGTNTFTLRQLSGKLNSNSILAGVLSFLIGFAIIGANVSFTMKVSEREAIEISCPFDVMLNGFEPSDQGYVENDVKSPITIEEGEAIMEEYSGIKEKIEFKAYDTGDDVLRAYTPWTGERYEGVTDMVISQSDFNRLWEALGHEPVDVGDGFQIIPGASQVGEMDFTGAELGLGGKTYAYGGTITEDYARLISEYLLAVVPDEAVEGLPVEYENIAYDLEDDSYDGMAMQEELRYYGVADYGSGPVNIEMCDYDVKAAIIAERNQFMAILIIGALYIALVFVFMAIAILALKTLSGLSDDRHRYRLLSQLGTDEKEQKKTLFRQIFSFFFLPFILPTLLSFPVAYLCGDMMKQVGIMEGIGEVYLISTIITVSVVVIYALYFTATYLISKRNVIHR
ncbi:MAG: ABC transporter permease [Bacillota bacterium]|nr:ABC transporter permease [Bacillota bacterium]